jgi:uncharacterized protein (TIGR03578 family)
MYQEKIHTVTVKGLAETKDGALGKALGQIQKTVSSEIAGVVFRIEPLGMEVVYASESSYTERFLGILFPRVRTKYELELRVNVRVVLIDVEKIPFKNGNKQLSTIQRFLQHN